ALHPRTRAPRREPRRCPGGGRMSGRPRVVVVGAGIAGLATARALRREAPDAELIVLESRDRPGGNVRTERVDGYVCEAGPGGVRGHAPRHPSVRGEDRVDASLPPQPGGGPPAIHLP